MRGRCHRAKEGRRRRQRDPVGPRTGRRGRNEGPERQKRGQKGLASREAALSTERAKSVGLA